jgi:methyl-accepting chemotaxis protein
MSGQERRPLRGGTSLRSRCRRGESSRSSLHDDAAPRLWSRAREASLLISRVRPRLAILGAFVITRRALRPVGDLARATQDILASGDLALRVRTRGTADDLDQLAALFNRMLGRTRRSSGP